MIINYVTAFQKIYFYNDQSIASNMILRVIPSLHKDWLKECLQH